MAKKMFIKEMYEEGLSKIEIKRRTNLNYRTVGKYAEQSMKRQTTLHEP